MKYLLGVVGVVLFVILAIVLIVSRAPRLTQEKSGEPVTKLVDEAKEGAVTYTTQGSIVSDQERRAIRIQVDKNQVRVDVLNGYGESVEKTQTFPNTSQSYETFLAALDVAGFANKRDANPSDERGMCPIGRTIIYEVKQGTSQETRLWSTSCSQKHGTFAGKPTVIQQLFQAQVPGYTKFVTGVKL